MLPSSFYHSYDSVIKIFVAFFFPDPQSRFVIDSTTAEVSVNAKLIEGQSTVVLKVRLFTKIGSHVLMQNGNSQGFPMAETIAPVMLVVDVFVYCIALLYIYLELFVLIINNCI